MQHSHWLAVFLATTLLFSPIAEAKRAGGGKSQGMTRTVQPAQVTRPTTPMQPSTPTTATVPQKSGSNVGGMVAAGVAGAAIGAVAANALADDNKNNNSLTTGTENTTGTNAEKEDTQSGFGWLFWLLLIGIALAGFAFFNSKKKLAAASPNPYSPNNSSLPSHGGGAFNSTTTQSPFARQSSVSGDNTNIFGQPVSGGQTANQTQNFGVYTNNGNSLPDGSEPASFLRIARQRFNHIQAMNSATNIEEIRRYLTDDLYQSMYNDIISNQDQDVAEFSNLTAMIADSTTENGQYIVSVRFSGMVSEDLNSLPQPFSEVWHFVKPAGSTEDWLVAGIQQD